MIKKTMMFLAACMLTSAVWAAVAIDGTTWKATVTPDKDAAAAGAPAFNETLQFKGNQLTTTANGFAPVAYNMVSADSLGKPKVKGSAWIAKQTDASGKTAEWRGEAKKDSMDGLYLATDAQGHPQRFTFQAKKG